MAKNKETTKVDKLQEVKKLNRGLTPVEMIKDAFDLNGKDEEVAKVLKKMPYMTGIQEERRDYDACFLVDGINKFLPQSEDSVKNYQDVSYADAALLAKAIATTQIEYTGIMATLVKAMVQQTLAAVKSGAYKPLVKNGGDVYPETNQVYIDRFISRASALLKSDVYSIVNKGPYFVFGWVDDQTKDD